MEKYYKSKLDFKSKKQVKSKSSYLEVIILILIIIGLIFLLFKGLNFAIDKWSIDTCDQWNDCEEVYKTLK